MVTSRRFECRPHESLRQVLRREGFFSVRFGAETGETGRMRSCWTVVWSPPRSCWPPRPTGMKLRRLRACRPGGD